MKRQTPPLSAPAVRRPVPRRLRDWPPVAWLAGALLLAGIPLLLAASPYANRLNAATRQLGTFPGRFDRTLTEMHTSVKPAYPAIMDIRENTFSDAVILVSDDPRDGPLAWVSWLAYYLYPRVLVQPKHLLAHPEIEYDYLLITPNFPPEMPDSLRGELILASVSARAQRHGMNRQPAGDER